MCDFLSKGKQIRNECQWTCTCHGGSRGSSEVRGACVCVGVGVRHTSNDCAYQSLTLLTEGISLSPSGSSLSSCTRCASLIGSSSARNCEARKRVPRILVSSGQRWCRNSHKRAGIELNLGEQRTNRGLLSELYHLAQADTGSRELGIVPDGVHQALRRLPCHGEIGVCPWAPPPARRSVSRDCGRTGKLSYDVIIGGVVWLKVWVIEE